MEYHIHSLIPYSHPPKIDKCFQDLIELYPSKALRPRSWRHSNLMLNSLAAPPKVKRQRTKGHCQLFNSKIEDSQKLGIRPISRISSLGLGPLLPCPNPSGQIIQKTANTPTPAAAAR